MSKQQRISVFKPTNDNWCPAYQLAGWWRGKKSQRLVEVTFTTLRGGDYRVMVWGADAMGLEVDFDGPEARMSAWIMFTELLEMKFVDYQPLIDMGFKPA